MGRSRDQSRSARGEQGGRHDREACGEQKAIGKSSLPMKEGKELRSNFVFQTHIGKVLVCRNCGGKDGSSTDGALGVP